MIFRVLVDNGSALNVLPLKTLESLPVPMKWMLSSKTHVRGFNGTRRAVHGCIQIPVKIGPFIYDIDFQVMDIEASYNALLGKPWIHSSRAVHSTLHQKVKFIKDDRLVTVYGEEEIIALVSDDAPSYVDPPQDVPEGFQTFEFVNAAEYSVNPYFSFNVQRQVRYMMTRGARGGVGLRKRNQRNLYSMNLHKAEKLQCLSYKRDHPDSIFGGQENKRRRVRHDSEEAGPDKKRYLPLYSIFTFDGMINVQPKSRPDRVVMRLIEQFAKLKVNVVEKV